MSLKGNHQSTTDYNTTLRHTQYSSATYHAVLLIRITCFLALHYVYLFRSVSNFQFMVHSDVAGDYIKHTFRTPAKGKKMVVQIFILHYLTYKFSNDRIITSFPTCTLFLPLDFQKYFEYFSSLIFIFYHFLICYQLKNNQKVEHEEIKKIVTSSNISTPACVATAMTTMVVGYVLDVYI